jgi:hypothetical protein
MAHDMTLTPIKGAAAAGAIHLFALRALLFEPRGSDERYVTTSGYTVDRAATLIFGVRPRKLVRSGDRKLARGKITWAPWPDHIVKIADKFAVAAGADYVLGKRPRRRPRSMIYATPEPR